MNIEMVDITKLVHPEYNPRFMAEDEKQRLSDEISEFGMVENVVVNKQNMHIVGGNQRVEILRRKGEKYVPVFYVDLTEDQEKRLNIALNKISGVWDQDKLKQMLSEIDHINIGFTDEEIKDLFGSSDINDLLAPDQKELSKFISFKFGSLRGDIPREIYESFVAEINRIKVFINPNEKPEEQSLINPLEYMIVQSQTTPLGK